MGERVAKSLISANVLDYLEVGSDISIIEIMTPKMMVGHNLIELNLRHKYGITIISVKNSRNEIKSPPDINNRFQTDDIVTLIGENRQFKKLGFIE
jgi:trk system potassium uptake protein TrkA